MMGPVLRLAAARVKVGHLYVSAAIRGVAGVNDRLRFALERGPWLLGAQFSAADWLCFSPCNRIKDAMPDDPLIRDRVARCLGRPLIAKVRALDQAGVVQDVAA